MKNHLRRTKVPTETVDNTWVAFSCKLSVAGKSEPCFFFFFFSFNPHDCISSWRLLTYCFAKYKSDCSDGSHAVRLFSFFSITKRKLMELLISQHAFFPNNLSRPCCTIRLVRSLTSCGCVADGQLKKGRLMFFEVQLLYFVIEKRTAVSHLKKRWNCWSIGLRINPTQSFATYAI